MPSATAARPWPDVSPVHPPGRIGLIGAGAFGQFCLDAYQRSSDLAVVAVADPNPETLAEIGTTDILRERDWHALLEDGAVEIVHLATPPDLRLEMALAALQARKSVFAEKPLALSIAGADAILEAATRFGAAVGIDYVMRHHPAYRLLETLASSLPFGLLRTISLENYAQAVLPGHWFWDPKRSGGIFVEHGVHFFDAYGRIAGKALWVWGSTPHPEAVEARVQYASGAFARFYHEFAYPEEVERAVGLCVFERGYIEIQGWIPTRLKAAVLAPIGQAQEVAAALRLETTVGENGAVHLERSFGNRDLAYQAAIVSGMRDLLHRHRDPRHRMTVEAEDGRESLALAIAAQHAASSGRRIALCAPESYDDGRELS